MQLIFYVILYLETADFLKLDLFFFLIVSRIFVYKSCYLQIQTILFLHFQLRSFLFFLSDCSVWDF